jgi:hypothetical protein
MAKETPIPRKQGEVEVVNANHYVTSMLSATFGLKLSDATRRILSYTKPHHTYKRFYAFSRGWYPIQEVCGVMTALNLAKRDILGIPMPLWKVLAPGIMLHATVNFRGMKVSSNDFTCSCKLVQVSHSPVSLQTADFGMEIL